MIRSFRDKALERFFATGDGRRLSVQNTRRLANILRALDDATRPEDMNLPGFRFRGLGGTSARQFSFRRLYDVFMKSCSNRTGFLYLHLAGLFCSSS